MDQLRQRLTAVFNFLLLTLLGLPLISPLLRATAVPCTHDGHLHYHRIAAMRHAWENGIYFTRWFPDLAFGYGYPFFVYREPTPLYLPLGPHLLGMPLPAASNLFYALTILACGWFMFLWVRDLFGTRPALLAAFAYMSAPYVLVDAFIRGNSPESLALPLFPLLLWAGRRWLLDGGLRPFLIATLSLAFFSLSHNISLLIFTPTLLLYLLIIGRARELPWWPLLGRLVLLFGIGLGMTSFYSGGALLELDSVTLEQSTVTRNNDFRFNFTSWGEILAPVQPSDSQLLNAPLPFRLGWIPVGLALIGVIRALFGWSQPSRTENGSRLREQKAHLLLMLAGTAVFLFLSFPSSQPLWENVPLVDFIQFPWRMVGRAALPLAFLAGLAVYRGERDGEGEGDTTQGEAPARLSRPYGLPMTDYGLLALFLLLLFLETVPNLYPRMCSEESFPTISDVHGYEQETGLVGVDPEGSYFPRTVEQRPSSSPLLANYAAGEPPQRFEIPTGVTVFEVNNRPLGGTARLQSATPFIIRFRSFDFPGWTATVNGRSVPITPSDPEGLITFTVPRGSSLVDVRWQSTPLRSLLVMASIMSLSALLVVCFVLFKEMPFSVNRKPFSLFHPHQTPNTEYRILFPLVALLILLKFGLFDQLNTPLRQAGEATPAITTALQGAELRLSGYTLSQASVAAGSTFDIDLAWTAVSNPPRHYQSNVWLADENGLLWSDKETQRPRQYEDPPFVNQWQAGQWGWDSREVAVLPGTPPGTYDIVVTLFDRETLQPLTLTDSKTGAVVGPTAVLGQMQVVAPSEPPTFAPQRELQTAVPPLGLTLLGVSQDRAEAAPGESVLFNLFWERTADSEAQTAVLTLENGAGETVQSWTIDLPLGDGTAWATGERRRGQSIVRLAGDLESGSYAFVLEGVAIGEIVVNAPERLFEQPEVETAVDAPLTLPDGTPQATLIGLTRQPIADGQLPITLVWQADAPLPVNYRVFVHLVDAAGNIVTQADGQPAQWTRPTTGWATGEYIIDAHLLPLPDETDLSQLTLRVGLYDAQTGERLLGETADFIPILD